MNPDEVAKQLRLVNRYITDNTFFKDTGLNITKEGDAVPETNGVPHKNRDYEADSLMNKIVMANARNVKAPVNNQPQQQKQERGAEDPAAKNEETEKASQIVI